MIATELNESKERLEELDNAFNLCDPEFIDIIIYAQMAEKARFEALLRLARNNKCLQPTERS